MVTPSFDFGRDATMPDATARAFAAHYDAALAPSGRIEQAKADIETVYDAHSEAVVSVSGGKDSMTVLALAAESDVPTRALHWDYGTVLVPREIAQELVANIRTYAPDAKCYVGHAKGRPQFRPYAEADGFRANLTTTATDDHGPIGSFAVALRDVDRMQLLGLRRGESGRRARQIDGLYGESLGQRVAFPIRDWSARDVWAYIVGNDVPYPSYYDRVAAGTDDGSPEAYERTRMSTMFDAGFAHLGSMEVDGVAAWEHRFIPSDDE